MTRKIKKIVTVRRDYRRVALLGSLLLLVGFTMLIRSSRVESVRASTQKPASETVVPVAAKLASQESASLPLEPRVAYAAVTPPALTPTSAATTTRKTIIIQFEYNSSALSQKDKQRLLLETLPSFDGQRLSHITIVGHSDSDGREEHNYALSLKRAESVMMALGKIVETKENVSLKAVGSRQPIFVGSLEDRAASRRVEIEAEYVFAPASN